MMVKVSCGLRTFRPGWQRQFKSLPALEGHAQEPDAIRHNHGGVLIAKT